MSVDRFDYREITDRIIEFQKDRGYSNADMARVFSIELETYKSLKYSKGKTALTVPKLLALYKEGVNLEYILTGKGYLFEKSDMSFQALVKAIGVELSNMDDHGKVEGIKLLSEEILHI